MVGDGLEVALATDLALIIIAAAIFAAVAIRTGQPTIIAYITTGLLLGPAVFGLVSPGPLTETMAELGLAFLLFLLGIKMRLEAIRGVLVPVVKISIPQMALVALVGIAAAWSLGFGRWESVLIGLAVMYSSTAVIIKMLTDKGTATSLHGKLDIGVLLVQDIVVVILLAMLAVGRPESVVEVTVTLASIVALVAAIGIVAILSSRYLLPPVFRHIADRPQIFFLVAFSWLFLFLIAAEELDLSIEMGAFLAGIAIAQLPYSKELQARVAPLTDLFVLVFFVSVSLELVAEDLLVYWEEAIIATLILMPAKFIIFFALIRWQSFDLETTFLGSINMTQVSEFGLIVGAVAVTENFIDEGILGFLTIVALLSMAISVYFINFNNQLFTRARPYLDRWDTEATQRDDSKEYRNHVVVVGFDEIAQRAIALLDDHDEDIVVIDRNLAEIEAIEAAGYEAVFGDVKYRKIRDEAGLAHADVVFSSSVQTDLNRVIVREAKDDATIIVEAKWATDATVLYDEGADYVVVPPDLSAEQLQQYIETYLGDRDAFDNAVSADLDRLRSGTLFPVDQSPSGGLDD